MSMFLPLISPKPVSLRKSHPNSSVYTGRFFQETSEGRWSFQLFSDHIIKSTFRPAGYSTNEQISNAVILKPAAGVRITLNEEEHRINFANVAGVSFKDKKYAYHFLNGSKNLSAEYFAEFGYKGFRFQLQKDEKIFGGGERALPLNRRGFGFNLFNSPAFGYGEGANQLNFSVPFVISSKGYGIFFDNPSTGYLDIGNKNPNVLEAGFTSGELTYYIINGKNVDEILKHYTELVGRQSVPARWVLGNLMSRFGYRSEEQLTAIVEKMQEENFPIDAVILDLFWFGDSVRNTMGNLDWTNSQKWPEPERMIRNLKKQGINTVLITEPYVVMGTKNYAESKKYHAVDSDDKPYTLTNFYFGFGGLLDLFRQDAKDWFWTKYKKQIEKGIAGWWGDLGEPETHPGDVRHHLDDLGFSRLFSANEVHNIYGHYWNKMLFDKYREEYPDTRLFNLNRSGYSGSQRYSVFPWSGDVGRNWSGLRAQLPVMLGMSMSGVPYIHADAGGFAHGEKDPELYTRWLQFAAFTPVFRPHGTALEELDPSLASIESEPVFYPEPYKSIVRNAIRLRYDLLPYNYSLAYQQAKDGKPLTRPMFYYDSSDDNLFKAEDQYMWGDSILVAPVLQKGALVRNLYLPKGHWYKYNSNVKVKGGQWINELTTIDNIPLYVKAGAFIPQVKGLQNTDGYHTSLLQLTYYPDSSNSSYTLYDDDGKTNMALETGKYELLHFDARVEELKYFILVSSNGGQFEKKPSSRRIMLSIPGLLRKPDSIKLNEQLVKVDYLSDEQAEATGPKASWNPRTAMLCIGFDFTGTAKVVEISK